MDVKTSKRHRPTNGAEGAQQLHMKKRMKDTSSAFIRPQQDCAILRLPGELRNRIYKFATEEYRDIYIPYLFSRAPDRSIPTTSNCKTFRQTFYLTQACYQLRKEYRPLWLREWKTRIQYVDLENFLQTFYPIEAEDANGPNELWISWGYDDMNQDDWLVTLDVTKLLLLRAHHFETHFEFYARQTLDGDGPDDDFLTYYYGADIDALDSGSEDLADFHEHARMLWKEEVEKIHYHLAPLNKLLNHKNTNWLRDIGLGNISQVSVIAEPYWPHIEVHIIVDPTKSSMSFPKHTRELREFSKSEALSRMQAYGFEDINIDPRPKFTFRHKRLE